MNSEESKKKIEALTDKINYHNELYYQKSKSEISDFEFDKLLESLVKLENDFPELKKQDSPTQRVGGTITKEFDVASTTVFDILLPFKLDQRLLLRHMNELMRSIRFRERERESVCS